jgi:adenylate kinase family enzyme
MFFLLMLNKKGTRMTRMLHRGSLRIYIRVVENLRIFDKVTGFVLKFCRSMKTKDIYIALPQTDEQSKALKAFLTALDIKFEMPGEKSYNPEFVKKVLKSRQQAKDGKVTRIKKENLKDFLGL